MTVKILEIKRVYRIERQLSSYAGLKSLMHDISKDQNRT